MASPSRPVLGEKSTNALVNKQEYGQNTKGSTQLLGTTVNTLASPLQAGRKRRYHEVESSSFEYARGKQEIARAGLGSQASSKPVTAETDEESESFMSSMIDAHSVNESCESLQTSTSTLLTSFHASQEPSQPIEEQFEIVQEESQRTLEQIVSHILCYHCAPKLMCNSMPPRCRNQSFRFLHQTDRPCSPRAHKTVSACQASLTSMRQIKVNKRKSTTWR